jgi:hypothetical protein
VFAVSDTANVNAIAERRSFYLKRFCPDLTDFFQDSLAFDIENLDDNWFSPA